MRCYSVVVTDTDRGKCKLEEEAGIGLYIAFIQLSRPTDVRHLQALSMGLVAFWDVAIYSGWPNLSVNT